MSERQKHLLSVMQQLAIDAGSAIMEVYNGKFTVTEKSDLSPVTDADSRSERIILAGLRGNFPEIPCVAEEEAEAGILPNELGDEFFLIDPLDGTREFINRNSEFTVNIALVRHGVPELGVVYAPASGMLFSGRPGVVQSAHVEGSARIKDLQTISVRACPERLTVITSRSHRTPETDEFIDRLSGADLVAIGSSLKFCLLASGKADIYPRFGRTMEWDTAAGEAILRAAGGEVVQPDGTPLSYGKRNQLHDADFANPSFIALTEGARRHL